MFVGISEVNAFNIKTELGEGRGGGVLELWALTDSFTCSLKKLIYFLSHVPMNLCFDELILCFGSWQFGS